jgi:hypothetical protein
MIGRQIDSVRLRMPASVSVRRGVLIVLAVLPLAVGCGGHGSAPLRVAAHGEVRVDDVPLKAGVIRFVPQAKGPVALTTIKDGRFTLSAANGPALGKNSIEIVAAPAANPLEGATDIRAAWTNYAKAKQAPLVETAVPAKYNQRTTLSVEVSAKGPNTFDFQLASQ